MLLAGAAAVAGYGMLLALRQEPLPHLAGRDVESGPRVDRNLPALQPLSEAVAVEASLARRHAASGSLRVQVAHLDPKQADGGLALFDGRSGALLEWIPFRSSRPSGAALECTATVPAGEHWLHAAGRADEARSRYFARTPCRVAADGESRVVLDVALHAVAIQMPIASGRALPMLGLRRKDDPAWRPSAGARLQPTPAGLLRIDLAAGDYELTLLHGSGDRFAFQVAGPAELTASFSR